MATEERMKSLQEGIKLLVYYSETEEWDEQIKEQEEVIRVQEGRMKVLVERMNLQEGRLKSVLEGHLQVLFVPAFVIFVIIFMALLVF